MSQCRICDSLNVRSVIDLGEMPLANRLKPAPDTPEKRFPLEVEFCRDCGNLQLTHCVEAHDLYDDYLYVTPSSAALEAHGVNLFYHMRARGSMVSATYYPRWTVPTISLYDVMADRLGHWPSEYE